MAAVCVRWARVAIICSLIGCFGWVGEASAQEPACPGVWAKLAPEEGWNRGFEVMGQSRSFWLMLPKASGPRPLLLALHGTRETGEAFARRARLRDFVERGFIVVAPQAVGNGTVWPVWDAMRMPSEAAAPNRDLAFFDRLLACLGEHLEVDPRRRYVGGHSAGGMMTNAVLQRRSEVFAGGVVASGVMSLTAPATPAPLSPLAVLVTWGGERDVWSGRVGSVKVSGFSFVEQAALASSFYAAQPGVQHMRCSADAGHAWLWRLNGWMIDRLLAHPKGSAGSVEWGSPPAGVTCSREAFAVPRVPEVECGESPVAGCQAACQMMADCAAENGTLRHVWRPTLKALGLGDGSCGGCVEACARVGAGEADRAVLACVEAQGAAARCGPGIEGALPMVKALNTCCAGRSGSGICRSACQALSRSPSALRFFAVCRP